MSQAKGDGWDQLNTLRLGLAVCVVGSHWIQIFLLPFKIVDAPTYQITRDVAWWCVVVFFLVSGLVIGRALSRRRFLADRLFLDFMSARIRRIYPTLLVSVALATSIGICLRASGTSIYAGTAIHPARTAYTYLDLWPGVVRSLMTFGFTGPGIMSGNSNGPLWSLSLEMQCYVIVGLICQVLAGRSGWLRGACLVGLCAIAIWLLTLAADGLLGTTYFVAFGLGFVASILPLRFPPVAPVLKADFSYSLYVLHFPIMLFFFFEFLQGAPSTVAIYSVALIALAASFGIAVFCGRYVEHYWERTRSSETRFRWRDRLTFQAQTSIQPAREICGDQPVPYV